MNVSDLLLRNMYKFCYTMVENGDESKFKAYNIYKIR